MASEQDSQNETARELTYGEQAVSLDFNHAEGKTHDTVHELKTLYARIIDILNDDRGTNHDERARHASVGITDAETAQMRAVKAVTFKREA